MTVAAHEGERPSQAAPEKKKGQTEYVVLRRNGATWDELPGAWFGNGAVPAARSAAETKGEAGKYVAVPARSFQPIVVEFENVPRVRVRKA